MMRFILLLQEVLVVNTIISASYILNIRSISMSKYNYNKDLKVFFKDTNCKISTLDYFSLCTESAYITVSESLSNCAKLYINDNLYSNDNTERYDMSAKFFTVLFFSILMIPCYIALLFFSCGLSKSSSDYRPV